MRLSPAFFYGAHQIFPKLAPDRIGEGLGGFVVEAIAAISILPYLAFLWLTSRWNPQSSAHGIFYSVLTGICINGKNCVLSAFSKSRAAVRRPGILAGRGAIMAIAGILVFSRTAILAENRRRCGSPSFGLLLLRK
jgi:bacterial/archaeal transporter family protein